jgi:hypothetical protein
MNYKVVQLGYCQYGLVYRTMSHAVSPWVSLLTNCMEQSLFEKLTDTQLVKKFPGFYGTRRFITVFTRARHWSLSSNSMKLSPSWEANSRSAGQEIPHILPNPKVDYRVHKSPPLDLAFSHLNPLHNFTPYLCSHLFSCYPLIYV